MQWISVDQLNSIESTRILRAHRGVREITVSDLGDSHLNVTVVVTYRSSKRYSPL